MEFALLAVGAATFTTLGARDTAIVTGATGTGGVTAFTTHGATMAIRAHTVASMAEIVGLGDSVGFKEFVTLENSNRFHRSRSGFENKKKKGRER
jgi:hypothetical protein